MTQKRVQIFSVVTALSLLVGLSCSAPDGTTQSLPTLTIAINAGEEGRAIFDLAPEYEHADVRVVELPYANLREKLGQVMRSGRSTYDVVMLDDPWFPELSPFLATLEDIPEELVQDLIPASLALGRDPYPNGAIKALPFVGNCQLLFYRTDILEQAGATSTPSSWAEVIALANRIEENTDASGYCIRGKSGAPVVTDFLPLLWSTGGSLFADRGNPRVVTIETAETVRALESYKRLADLSPDGAVAFDWNEMTAAFVAGSAAMQLNWPAAIAVIDEQVPQRDGRRVWNVALPPSGRAATKGTSMAGNWLLAVPSAATNPAEATNLIIWLMGKQEEAARSGNPPTRRSVFAELSGEEEFFYYPVLQEALEGSTPRPRTPKWNEVEDLVSQTVTAVLVGDVSTEEAAKNLQHEVTRVMQ